MEKIVEELIARTTEFGNLQEAFMLRIAAGMIAEEVLASIRESGIAVTVDMLKNMRSEMLPQAEELRINTLIDIAYNLSPNIAKALAGRISAGTGLILNSIDVFIRSSKSKLALLVAHEIHFHPSAAEITAAKKSF